MSNNRKKTESSSNLKSVKELIENKKDVEVSQEDQINKLLADNKNLCIIINDFKKKLDEKEAQIKHLEDMLSKSVPLISVPGQIQRIVKPDDKQIAEIQLEKLKQKAMSHELTLEEARKFEIFSKVKTAIEQKENENTIPGSYNQIPTDHKKLLEIASRGIIKKPDNTENE